MVNPWFNVFFNSLLHVVVVVSLLTLTALPRALAADDARSDHAETKLDGGRREMAPDDLEGVGIDEKIGGKLPLGLEFMDENGKKVRLSELFAGGKPVIMNLGYFKCPMLCHLVWGGMTQAVSELDWMAGREFEMVSVSIDPREAPAFAKLNKQKYMDMYGRPDAAAGWHFLTGNDREIKVLADALGFRYRYDADADMYYHTAAIFIITPDGKISRYLYGVAYEPVTLRLSLLEASRGKMGSTVDRIMMYCFHYDAGKGRYAPAAFNIMKLGGVITLFSLSLFLGGLWAFEKRKQLRTA